MPAGQHHLSSSLHLCPDQCAAKLLLIFIFEVNTMAISLSCHWSSTVSSLFTSIFFFLKALLLFKSSYYHLQGPSSHPPPPFFWCDTCSCFYPPGPLLYQFHSSTWLSVPPSYQFYSQGNPIKNNKTWSNAGPTAYRADRSPSHVLTFTESNYYEWPSTGHTMHFQRR